MEIPPDVQQVWEMLLTWIGFGTIAGLCGKAVVPGRDPGGTITTVAMGIFGTFMGCGIYSLWVKQYVGPSTDFRGLAFGTLGVAVILIFFRVLSGLWLEGDVPLNVTHRPHMRRRRRRCRYADVDYDEY
jgi:uncharacterized membrane protein YeaQ/YmgE (transglycosylase-associated protein family)